MRCLCSVLVYMMYACEVNVILYMLCKYDVHVSTSGEHVMYMCCTSGEHVVNNVVYMW